MLYECSAHLPFNADNVSRSGRGPEESDQQEGHSSSNGVRERYLRHPDQQAQGRQPEGATRQDAVLGGCGSDGLDQPAGCGCWPVPHANWGRCAAALCAPVFRKSLDKPMTATASSLVSKRFSSTLLASIHRSCTLLPQDSSLAGTSDLDRLAVYARKPPSTGSDPARSSTLASSSSPVSAANTRSPTWPSRASDLTGTSNAAKRSDTSSPKRTRAIRL